MLADTLQRYRLVAHKEGARKGFRQGLLSMPSAFCRGLRDRQPLAHGVFNRIALLDQLDDALASAGGAATPLTLCGVGKFPRLWLRFLKARGARVAGLLDFNICWDGQQIAGVGVRVVDAARLPAFQTRLMVGLASLADTARWLQLLAENRRAALAPDPAVSASRGIFDLARAFPVSVWA